MSAGPPHSPNAPPEGPVIAPLPSRAKKKRGRKPPRDRRALMWAGAFAIGLALGIVGYQWVPGVDTAFDTWLALALG
jgi:hypothetical protein